MRNRIVVWGRNAQEARVLIAVELMMEQNIVKIDTYAEKDVSDEVYKTFMDKWRKNEETTLPDPNKSWARELSVSENLLPEELKVEQSDMVNRAQTEWHYMVLSAKLRDAYRAELAEIDDRVERANKYDSNTWGQLKTFWEKVQQQLRDKTFLREHGNEIRKEVDGLFDKMKKLRQKLNEEIKEKSAEAVSLFATQLEELEKRTEEGTHLRKVFDDLKKLQSKFHNTTFSRDDRNLVYERIDKAFKAVKEKRSGGKSATQFADNALGRTQARYEGLLKAMEKMERSIGRDEKDLEFEHRRIARTNGQLEAEMRKAKIKMIESRVSSKREKLADMEKTKTMLEGRIEKTKKKLAKEQKKQAERAAAEALKAKHAEEMKAKQAEISTEEAAKLAKAAAEIKESKAKQVKPKQAAEPTGSTIIANAVAVSEIVTTTAPVAPTTVEASTTTEVAAEEKGFFEKASDFMEAASEKVADVVEDVVDTAKAVAIVAGDKISEAATEIKEEIQEEIREISGEEE
ncbi:MAG: hypothetical protein AAF828_08810 [Bacteroidota bacterium]